MSFERVENIWIWFKMLIKSTKICKTIIWQEKNQQMEVKWEKRVIEMFDLLKINVSEFGINN